MGAVVLHVLNIINAEGAGAEARERSKEEAASQAGTPGRTTVDFFSTSHRMLAADIALHKHGHRRGRKNNPIVPYHRGLVIVDLCWVRSILWLGHRLWGR